MRLMKPVLTDDQGTVLHSHVMFPIDLCFNDDGLPNLTITNYMNNTSVDKCCKMVVDQ
jgi:hypothetical protein